MKSQETPLINHEMFRTDINLASGGHGSLHMQNRNGTISGIGRKLFTEHGYFIDILERSNNQKPLLAA